MFSLTNSEQNKFWWSRYWNIICNSRTEHFCQQKFLITHSLWHMSQGNLGFTWSGRWHLLCRYNELNCLNAFPHCGHTWGRASVWTVLCDCRTVFWEKHFPHSSHLKQKFASVKLQNHKVLDQITITINNVVREPDMASMRTYSRHGEPYRDLQLCHSSLNHQTPSRGLFRR
jgi:hypothetical protein